MKILLKEKEDRSLPLAKRIKRIFPQSRLKKLKIWKETQRVYFKDEPEMHQWKVPPPFVD